MTNNVEIQVKCPSHSQVLLLMISVIRPKIEFYSYVSFRLLTFFNEPLFPWSEEYSKRFVPSS